MNNAPFIGIDLVEPDRLRDRLARTHGLAESLFTPGEIEYSSSQQDPVLHLASRYCAKEAVVKALGIDGFDPLEIEVLGGGPDAHLKLHGDVAAVAAALGVEVTISMSHLSTMATAAALARKREIE